MTPQEWLGLTVAALLAAGLTLWLTRRSRAALAAWARRASLQALHRFHVRLQRYKLVQRAHVRTELLADPLIEAAIARHAAEHGLPVGQVIRLVERYIDEIVPAFNVLSYYRLGYNLSRALIHLLYAPTVAHQDQRALERIPRGDVVVYLMNHRSNADYVVVAFVLARVVSISYAVGEWARTWPLEYIFKSFGSYFIRRRFREPLYHTVLERYVQLVTRHGVTQGLFLEGGLSRDGALQPAKIGLLDYLAGTLRDAAFGADIWLVPIGINYDRVLEDRSLIREHIVRGARVGRGRQLVGVARYLGWNVVRLLTGRLRRYGRVAVSFGTPLSLRHWLAEQPDDVLGLPRPERLPRIQQLADTVMERIGAVLPVTPVPLAAAALLSFGGSIVSRQRLLERLDQLRDDLESAGAYVVRGELIAEELWDRAWRMLRLRRLVIQQGGDLVILPEQRPLLEYYANSIRHLLPQARWPALSPAMGPDLSLPHLLHRRPLPPESPR